MGTADGLEGNPQGTRVTAGLACASLEFLPRSFYLVQEGSQPSLRSTRLFLGGGESLTGALHGCLEAAHALVVGLAADTTQRL